MRLLFLNPVGTIGGAERVLLDLVASLRAAAPSIDVHLAAAADGPLLDAARSLRVSATVLPLPPSAGELGDSGLAGGRSALSLLLRGPAGAWAAWRYGRQLRRFVDQIRPDVVHSNGIKFHLLTHLARLRGTPVVWHLHDFLSGRRIAAPALRWAARSAAGAVAVSRAV
ncbi:MAG TPA: glycosyltransferase, partial [Gemmataceae bacterium]|nr:glycosyltransferase [Gemmataceae bacterium]